MSNLRPALSRLKDKRDLVGVEIGVQLGKNAKVILDNLDIKMLYLIDPYVPYPTVSGKEEMAGTEEEHEEAFKEAKKRLSGYDNIFWFRFPSWGVMNYLTPFKWVDDPFNFVYIDGDHRYEAVKMDVELYYPKIKVGGLLCGHDAGKKEVKKAVSEFLEKIGGKMQRDGPDWFWEKSEKERPIKSEDCSKCGVRNAVTKEKWKCRKCSFINFTDWHDNIVGEKHG